MAAKHPKFVRQNVAQKKRVGGAWRKPRGIDNKQRVKKRWAGAMPNIGYRQEKALRYKRNGMRIVVVYNKAQLEMCDPARDCAVFAATLGMRKRAELIVLARGRGLRVLNSNSGLLGKKAPKPPLVEPAPKSE